MSARYAVYYAPPRDHPLTALASAWLGYDAWTAAPVARPVIKAPGLDEAEVEVLTLEPRQYGFHGTLKAPFRLAEGQTEAALIEKIFAFAAAQQRFEGELVVQSLSGFVALTLVQPSNAMAALHAGCVHAFEPFRAPLSDADLARRRRASMTAEQDSRLRAYGYPWVFEDFSFHMTLTGRVSDPTRRDMLCGALSQYLAAGTGPHIFDTICLFRQKNPQVPFRILTSSTIGFNV
jgi:hypothetical protein